MVSTIIKSTSQQDMVSTKTSCQHHASLLFCISSQTCYASAPSHASWFFFPITLSLGQRKSLRRSCQSPPSLYRLHSRIHCLAATGFHPQSQRLLVSVSFLSRPLQSQKLRHPTPFVIKPSAFCRERIDSSMCWVRHTFPTYRLSWHNS